MRLLLSSVERSVRPLDAEGGGRFSKLVEDAAPLGFEPTALCVREALG
jgi:hypothetical protein